MNQSKIHDLLFQNVSVLDGVGTKTKKLKNITHNNDKNQKNDVPKHQHESQNGSKSRVRIVHLFLHFCKTLISCNGAMVFVDFHGLRVSQDGQKTINN